MNAQFIGKRAGAPGFQNEAIVAHARCLAAALALWDRPGSGVPGLHLVWTEGGRNICLNQAVSLRLCFPGDEIS